VNVQDYRLIEALMEFILQTKYFDSGDYNMAKAKTGSSKPPIGPGQKLLLPGSTGDAIPTPESVPQRKISFNQKKLAGMSWKSVNQTETVNHDHFYKTSVGGWVFVKMVWPRIVFWLFSIIIDWKICEPFTIWDIYYLTNK